MLILNLKTYPQSTGANSAKLLASAQNFVEDHPELNQKLFFAPAIFDLSAMREQFKTLNITAPHVDPLPMGKATGWAPAQSLLDQGIKYAIYNHSEHRMWDEGILDDIRQIQATGMQLIVCCENLAEAEQLLEVKPMAIAFEDKELIGSGQSITTARAEDVKKFIELVKGTSKAIIGAGISSGDDVKAGLAMGGDGFILASAFVNADDKYKKLKEFCQAYK